MVDFNEFMGLALTKCAPTGPGTQEERREVFQTFADVWNQNKESIKEMDPAEAEDAIQCG